MNINRPILIIPSLAIHMNRNVNQGVEINRQKDVLPLMTMINDSLEKDNILLQVISEELNVYKEEILSAK